MAKLDQVCDSRNYRLYMVYDMYKQLVNVGKLVETCRLAMVRCSLGIPPLVEYAIPSRYRGDFMVMSCIGVRL